ncbi:MAG: ABC transporter ATP-binding protein [Patescibacteria group bacterium]|jgi:putative ABC transport system ATP-binding protein
MSEPLFSLKGLVKTYQNGEVNTPVLQGVDLKVEKGEFVALMGPSGSGKSTLMHILGFLDRLTSGSYLFSGRDVSQMTDDDLAHERSREVGFVFQSFNLLAKSTVIENVMLPMLYAKVPKKEREERAMNALRAVGIEHRANYVSNTISGGEKQRVAIARALVNSPSVIFADEPTGNLDTKSGEAVLAIFQDLHEKQGRTIVMVTHELEAAEFADRIVRIRDGVIESDEKNLNKRRGGYYK